MSLTFLRFLLSTTAFPRLASLRRRTKGRSRTSKIIYFILVLTTRLTSHRQYIFEDRVKEGKCRNKAEFDRYWKALSPSTREVCISPFHTSDRPQLIFCHL